MPVAASNANQQTAALQKRIAQATADGQVTRTEARRALAAARAQGVQVGELRLLRGLATSSKLKPEVRDAFIRSVDRLVPDGAPTAQLAAILFRVDPSTGRKQLLRRLEGAKPLVPGGPRSWVITGLGRPYLAAITTAQVILGLTKFLEGATPKDQVRIRAMLGEQLLTLRTPVGSGGLAVPGVVASPKGLAFSDDTREGAIIAVNQQAVVLRALDKLAQVTGPENAALARSAQRLGRRVARELLAELRFAYPATGRMAYSLKVNGSTPATVRLEDGDHLQTTLQALTSLQVFAAPFEKSVARIKQRYPEISFCGPEDLSGNPGQIYTTSFNAFRLAAGKVLALPQVTPAHHAQLEAAARQDGFLSPGERGLLSRVKKRIS